MVAVPLKAQESVYDRLLGITPYPAILYEESSPSLSINLHTRYDNLLELNNGNLDLQLKRWSFGATVNWHVSQNQQWHIELQRMSETAAARHEDFSWNVNHSFSQDRFRITHQRRVQYWFLKSISFFRVYVERDAARWNLGLGVQWRKNAYTLGYAIESKSWHPLSQLQVKNNENQVDIILPTAASLQQMHWTLDKRSEKFNLKAAVSIGELISSKYPERDYSFMPSADLLIIKTRFQMALHPLWLINLSYLECKLIFKEGDSSS
jgi:hypothetical protein